MDSAFFAIKGNQIEKGPNLGINELEVRLRNEKKVITELGT